MDVPLTVLLGGPPADPATLGGKGAALQAMVRAGLPVPASGVVTTAAYQRATGDPGIADLIGDLGARRREPSNEQIDRAFLKLDLPAAITSRALLLFDEVRRRAGVDTVAVRSSATTEDLASASFAGQHRSLLGVDDEGALLRGLRLVWASLWHRAPRAYRRFHGVGSDVAMAVVIMAMVPARRAGVAFTRDPGGSPDRVRVESVEGLAEGLVSGRVTPTCHLVDRRAPAAAGAPRPVADVAALSMRCEDLFGRPQDVEWAWDGSTVWLVQSRPIVAARQGDDGFDSAVGRTTRYTTAGIAEMLPGVLPVLRWSSASLLVDEAFRVVADQLHAMPPDMSWPEGFVVRTRGRAAMNLDALARVATSVPGGSVERFEQQYFGAAASEPAPRTRAPLMRRVAHDLRVHGAHRRARREAAVVATAARLVADRAPQPDTLTDGELLGLRERTLDLAARAMSAELAAAAAAAATYERLAGSLRRYLGDAGDAWAQRVTRSAGDVTVAARATNVGQELAHACPLVLDEPTWSAARALLQRQGRRDCIHGVEQLGQQAGSRSVFAGPTWDEDPEALWSLVRAGAARPSVEPAGDERTADCDALEAALTARPGWMRTRVLTGQVVDVRLHLVRRTVSEACDLLRLRESAKAAVLSLGGVVRRLEREIGHRLRQRGLLETIDDVELLTPAEMAAGLLTGTAVPADVRAERRACVQRWAAEDDLPQLFTGVPGHQTAPLPAGSRLSGWPAGPGRHTGHVLVLHSPDEARVHDGDVVVARRTDASWSPIFLRAGAVVVEEGGPLSHAAIVARELGLPAVVNVPGATTRLGRPDVDRVTVDGDAGLVVVLDQAGRGLEASSASTRAFS